MTMQPHQERVVEEHKALTEKLDKLTEFLKGDMIEKLPKEDQVLLKEQHEHMQAYASVLAQRIVRFEA